MSKTVDTLFKIMHLINKSGTPITAEEIASSLMLVLGQYNDMQ